MAQLDSGPAAFLDNSVMVAVKPPELELLELSQLGSHDVLLLQLRLLRFFDLVFSSSALRTDFEHVHASSMHD